MKFVYAFFTLFGVTLVSFLLAISTDMSHQGLGGLINYIWPPIVGLVSGILYVVLQFIFKSDKIRIAILFVLCLYILYVGFALHFDNGDWPLVIW
jgi:cobalamin synthase